MQLFLWIYCDFVFADIDRIVDLLSLNELSSCQGDGGSWWTWLLFNAMVACLQGLLLASIKQKSAALRQKNKDWLARNQDNVS
jgi:hypothetical protein